MALLEQEATRFAEALDDYEHVSVTDIGGWGPTGFWVTVRDHRFNCPLVDAIPVESLEELVIDSKETPTEVRVRPGRGR